MVLGKLLYTVLLGAYLSLKISCLALNFSIAKYILKQVNEWYAIHIGFFIDAR